jgi:TetR/AcrR family transcriptional regulator, copper-responsive repressor
MAGKKQFDLEAALEAVMLQFWRAGYADTSVDDLSRVTGLNRSSIYGSLGDKDTLYLRCLDRYATRYGERFDAALARAGDEPHEAVAAFFEVTLRRIADPDLPDGCLIAQSALVIPALSPAIAARTVQAVESQRGRLHAALRSARLSAAEADAFAVHLAAVNQSLAVMSRAGATPEQLRAVVAVSLRALRQACP